MFFLYLKNISDNLVLEMLLKTVKGCTTATVWFDYSLLCFITLGRVDNSHCCRHIRETKPHYTIDTSRIYRARRNNRTDMDPVSPHIFGHFSSFGEPPRLIIVK